MNSALVHMTLLGLISSAVAQNNGIFSTGFLGDNSFQRNRLGSARLVPSLTTTTEPQFDQPELPQFDFEDRSGLRSGQQAYRIGQNQESIIPRKQSPNQFFQDNQHVQDTNIFNPVHTPAVKIGSPAVTHLSPEAQARNEKERLEQNKSAKYSFNSAVSDTIFDNSHVREEVRDGLKLAGLYSYSDGFYKRTVHYIADENGYRVVKEDVEPIGSGEGPLINPNGAIDVASNYDGASNSYHATAKDIPSLFKPQIQIQQQDSPSKLLTPPSFSSLRQ